jgi:phosphatidylserine decarboxylase
VPPARLGIVAPVDGRVTDVQRIEQGPFGGPALRVRIAISPWTVYGVRAPVEGVVCDPATLCRSVGYHRGLCLRTDEGQPLLLRLADHGFGAAKPKVNIGQRLGHGERCGSVRFAHSAELLVPATAAARVAAGEPVAAGTSVLAEFAPR